MNLLGRSVALLVLFALCAHRCVHAVPQSATHLSFSPVGSFVYPIVGTKVSSDFGARRHPVRRVLRHHSGVDLSAPRGAMIRAVSSGRVIFADPYAGYGNLVVIDHGNGFTTHYGHCDKIRVKPGERVNAGAIIATVGSTGLSTGPHLHFEIRKEGKPQDPEKYIPGLSAAAEG